MPAKPAITISKTEARRFILARQNLYPPRQQTGKMGVLDFIQQVGSIQFDPINIVGRNPDLVLQSRVRDYRPEMLDELLYEDRKLLDGWDKMASIYRVEDWPNFARRREIMRQPDADRRRPPEQVLEEILEEVRQRGPVSSLDFSENKIVDWHWGPTKMVRAALESLFGMSKIGVHHRVNNRRAFDLIERLIPAELLIQPDPFASLEDYQHWHVLRRIGSMGLVDTRSGEYWLGILGMKSRERQAAIKKLNAAGKILPVEIEELPNQVFYIRQTDLATLKSIQTATQPQKQAAFIGALDNLIWNRKLIAAIFDFEYIWEVYKPKAQRQYGYYVLPVLYGDRFIARFDPSFDKKKRVLTLNNWWWEADVQPTAEMKAVLQTCLQDFLTYLDAKDLILSPKITAQPSLNWLL